MSTYPPGCFVEPLKIGDELFESIWHAESYPDFLQGSKPVRGKDAKRILDDASRDAQSRNSPLWLGTNSAGDPILSYEELFDLEKTGHVGYQKTINQLSHSIPPIEVPRRRMKRYRSFEDGEEIDIDRYLDNKADYHIAYKRTKAAGIGYVCIWVNAAILAERTESHFFWRGATALALAEALDHQGHSVEIRIYLYGRGRYKDFSLGVRTLYTFPIKTYNEQINTSKMSVPLCSPGWYRTRGFCSYLRRPYSTLYSNMGSSISTTFPKEALLAGSDDIFVDNIWTKEAAQTFLTSEVARLTQKVDCYA